MRTLIHSLAAGLLAVVLAAAAHAGPLLQFIPDRTKVHGTEALEVDLVLSGLAPGTQLAGIDLSLHYDPSMLTLYDVTVGHALGDPQDAAQTVVDVVHAFWLGQITLAEVSLLEGSALGCAFCVGPYLDELQSGGPLLLATLLFHGTGTGVGAFTTLQFTDLMLADQVGDAIGGVMVQNVTIAIDEPPAAALLGAALVAALSTAAAVRRRRGGAARS